MCIFCHKKESQDCFVCSVCVQKIIRASLENIAKAVQIAVEQNYIDKADTLNSYMEEMTHDGKQTRPGKHNNGRRADRTVWTPKTGHRQSAVQRRAALHKGKYQK